MEQNIKESLEYLSNLCLENAGNKINYTDEDLADTVMILQEVLSSKMYDFHKDKLSKEQMLQLAEESGKSIRQTILLFTGVDLHDVYKK
jgi:hypothetical protein